MKGMQEQVTKSRERCCRRVTDLDRNPLRAAMKLLLIGFVFGSGFIASLYAVTGLIEVLEYIGRFVS